MDTATPDRRKFRFGVFQLDLASGELYKQGIRIKLQDQPCQVLAVLLERPGELVTRDELRQRLWGHDTYVDFDHSLNISINKLRDALGDSPTTPRFIETLPRKGYRFLAPVSLEQPSEPAVAPPFPAPTAQGTRETTSPTPSVPGKLVAWAVGAGLVFIVLLGLWLWRDKISKPSTGRVMLAILPFEDLSADHGQDYFIAGLHDEMIAQLGRLHPSELGVIARTSTVQYATARKPVDQIGRDLHVDYVLDGAIRRNGDRYRITAELIKVADQTHLWSETYEPSMGDMLAMQEDVSRRVSQALSVEFLPEAKQEFLESKTENADAYDAYLQGRFLWHQETRSSLEQAIVMFQKAIALDPNYAPAYVGLADAYSVLGGYGFVPAEQVFPKAKAAARKALELAPNLSEAYGTLAFESFYYDWDFPQAETLFRKAIALNPNNELAHEFYSSFLHVMGRLDEAEAENQVAKKLAPLDGWLYDDRGWMMLSRRRPQVAIGEFQRSTELNPQFPAAHLSLAVAYMRTQQYDKALTEVRRAQELNSDPTRALEILGSVQAASGDVAGARATLQRLLKGEINGRVSPYSVALIYTALGQKPEALDWLEKGYREKDTWTIWIGVLVEWDSLRSEPRFVNLVRQLKL